AATSAAQLDAYLAGKGSPMAGSGNALMASGGRWQIDPRLIIAIAGAESNFGSITCAPFNAWGYGCPNGPYNFSSWAEGVDTVAQGLRTNYLSEGRVSVALINLKYAPLDAANDPTGLNNNWTANVSRFLLELGGDPSDIDTGKIGGTRLLGLPPALDPVAAAASSAFGFEEPTAVDAASPDEAASAASDLTVRAGAPEPLVVEVKNTGSATWTSSNVRLRRTDLEPRVVGAPYGALDSAEGVAPGETGRFIAALAASGASDGSASTTWQLEGPSGAFGSAIERTVTFEVPAFVAADARIDVAPGNGGINPDAAPLSTVVVHVRNVGSTAWRRDGDDAVQLVARLAAGQPLAHDAWLDDVAAAHMLERTAAPGEEASFAFRVRGTDGGTAFRLQRGDAFASGRPIVLQVGAITPDERARLQAVGDDTVDVVIG
ncbi:MAG: hypothetical protein H7287_01335, partial [Thermoleophilia bacterium]|nr:hypothetical protein [Thermoleophilia bacterium]